MGRYSENYWMLAIVRIIRFSVLIALLLVTSFIGMSQADSLTAVTLRQAIIRAGPSATFTQTGLLPASIEVTIIERNRIGNWLYIESDIEGNEGDLVQGWTTAGTLQLPDGLQFSELAINEDVLDADNTEATFIHEDLAHLYTLPILPTLSPAMIEVYERGQALGNNADVMVKVGDSNSVSGLYLAPIASGDYDLGAYDFLQTTTEFYADSFDNRSVAAQIGLNAFSVFDPIWAYNTCEAGESPLACEYRLSRPSVAIVMFGQNDTRVLNREQFDEQMRLIVETSLEAGIIPVLVTFTNNPEMEELVWWQGIRFNLITANIAQEYDVPLLNFWIPAQELPDYGIGADNVHLTSSGTTVAFNGYESRFGLTLYNLLVLQGLYIIRVGVGIIDN